MKRETKTWLTKLSEALSVGPIARDALDSDARLRAEVKLLRNFARGAATYLCSCGDGDVCVGCAARFTLRRVAALKPRRARVKP